jgi:hypothetical protein
VAGLSVPVTEKEVETAGKVGERIAEAALEKGAQAVEPVPVATSESPSEGSPEGPSAS